MPPYPSDQECPRRRSPSPAVKDSSDNCSAGVMSRGMPQARSRSELDDGVSLWAAINPDILGIVLRFLPSLTDRASVRSVCRHWRTGPHGHVLPAPLPLLVLPEFKFSILSDGGFDGHAACPGGWLVGVTPYKDRSDEFFGECDGECFLVNVFSSKLIRLPQLCNWNCLFDASSFRRKTLGVVNVCANLIYGMSFCQVVLSASPDSETKYTVAASSNHKGSRLPALWQPGMKLWHVCCGVDIDGPIDLTFYKGKLYVLLRHRKQLFSFELEDDHGFMVCRVEHCLTDPPLNLFQEEDAICHNMVVWRDELLLIIRHYNDRSRQVALRVEVFALDVSTNPYGLSEIRSFNGDCIFVGSGGCKSFPAGLHDGVEGDLIYFVPDDRQPYDRFVYSMRDGRMKPFGTQVLASCLDVPVKHRDFPVWLLPTE